MGVPSPLTSYAFVRQRRNWGLFVAVEEPEDAFARRNLEQMGNLYKPEYKRLSDDSDISHLLRRGISPYENIFERSVFKVNDTDKKRLIESLRILSTGETLKKALMSMPYSAISRCKLFVVNLDGYWVGRDTITSSRKKTARSPSPWDYNLLMQLTLGMPNPIDDSTLFVNCLSTLPLPMSICQKTSFLNL